MDTGKRYAYRQWARTPEDPVRPVELVREGPPRSQKVRVRWLDGEYEGLEEWVLAVRLVAPWEETAALLEDERRMLAALEGSGDVYGTVLYRACELVFFAVPQESGAEVFFGTRAIELELLVIDDLEAAATRLGLAAEELLSEPLAFVDRSGEYRAPFGVAVKVAGLCCQRFAGEVLGYLREREVELRTQLISGDLPRAGWVSPERVRGHARAELERAESVFALVRRWCGEESVARYDEVVALREEVDRLRAIIGDTVRWLRDSGHPVKAGLLSRDLGRNG
jgi:hypothetical protein